MKKVKRILALAGAMPFTSHASTPSTLIFALYRLGCIPDFPQGFHCMHDYSPGTDLCLYSCVPCY